MLEYFRRENGQDLAEYALIFPVLMLLLLGIMEFGAVIFSYDSIANAAREGVRYGVIHHNLPADSADIEAAARRSTMGLDQNALQFTISEPTTRTIRVEVEYDHSLMTGLIIEAVGGTPTLPLYAVATMQIE